VLVAGPSGPLVVRTFPAPPPSDADPGEPPEPVVFVHPVNTGGAVWHRVAPALLNAMRQVGHAVGPALVPDLRGHGRSTLNGPFGAEAYAADVLAVLDHFGVSRAHVVGASIGGPVGVLLAARAPRRVLSIASFGGALELRMTDDQLAEVDRMLARGVDALLDELIPASLGMRYRTTELVAETIAIARGTGRAPHTVSAIIRGAFSVDVSAYAPAVRVPSLVVNGSEDGAATPGAGRRMADQLGSDPVVLPGIGHLPMMEDPATVVALLMNHLRTPVQPRRRGPVRAP
jgi:pimeloyl-ACP methyl ester carboxylesterase